MNSPQQRQMLLPLITEAVSNGARLHKACAQIGLSTRTVQRWQHPAASGADRRVASLRTRVIPPNKLTDSERETAICGRGSNGWPQQAQRVLGIEVLHMKIHMGTADHQQ